MDQSKDQRKASASNDNHGSVFETRKYVEMYCFEQHHTKETMQEIKEYFTRRGQVISELTNQSLLKPLEEKKVDTTDAVEAKQMSNQNEKLNSITFLEKQVEKAMKGPPATPNLEPINSPRNPSIPHSILIKYTKRQNWAKLRVFDFKEEILSTIRNNRIVIIRGFTGSGKSTQIPQYIADEHESKSESYNIIITQPRRVAAKMLATRVAEEMRCELGTTVGYQIGLDRTRTSKNTKILYCTTGVLLQRFITTPSFSNYSHIIIDEVHERSADVDMLLLILKKMSLEQDLKTRVILMSATFDFRLLRSYFTLPKTSFNICPALIDINRVKIEEEAEQHSTEIYYLDDIISKIQLRLNFSFSVNSTNKTIFKDFEDFMFKNDSQKIIFDINFPTLHKTLKELIPEILVHFVELGRDLQGQKGSILIFLPGLSEIMSLKQILEETVKASSFKWKIHVLHSTVSLKEQTEIMKNHKDGFRHIILATNIAESSLTVPNVQLVIDFCLCKTLVTSRQGYALSCLSLEWSSQSSCDQRAGRTGRTMDGQVFRLIPQNFYNLLPEFDKPEFEKIPLDNYILKTKLIDPKLTPKEILAYALSPPSLEDIENSIISLKRAGALTVYVDRVADDGTIVKTYDPEDGTLTSLGRIMSLLPIDIMLSKMVALGLVFDVVEDAIIIAASHCTPGFFVKRVSEPIPTYKSRLSWANNSFSDSLAYFKAYKMFKTLESNFYNPSFAEKWCFRNSIDYQRLLELETLISEISARLKYNMKVSLNRNRHRYKKSEQEVILKVLIAAAFYPNYFFQKFAREEALERFSWLSPNTVILEGFSKDSLTTALYIQEIKRHFQECSKKIDFKVDGSFVFMTLDSNSYETSIDEEDHTLYDSFQSHFNSNLLPSPTGDLEQFKSFFCLNKPIVPPSVYIALTQKRQNRNYLQFYRCSTNVEQEARNRLVSLIKDSAKIFIEQNNKLSVNVDNAYIVAKICHNEKKYVLPKMGKPPTSCRSVTLHISHFLSPQVFFGLYSHSFTQTMMDNLNTLNLHFIDLSSTPHLLKFPIESGDLVIAPLFIDKFSSLRFLANHFQQKIYYTKAGKACIMARAEVLKISKFRRYYLYFIDFGLKDHFDSPEDMHKLNCRFRFSVPEMIKNRISDVDLMEITTFQHLNDKFFLIPPLAVKCQLARVRLLEISSECQLNEFILADLRENSFTYTASIYSFLNDQLSVELYSTSHSFDSSLRHSALRHNSDISLNEKLVRNDFAEFKIEPEICQYNNQVREANNFLSKSSNENAAQEFAFIFDDLFTEYQININMITQFFIDRKSKAFEHFKARGPFSPFEVNFVGITRGNISKTVSISKNSVNTVALDTNVSEKHSKMLVAGDVNLAENNRNNIVLNNTTLMPNIMDFPAFMCLLFAPTVEFRVNKQVSEQCYGMPEEICGAISGLGFDPISKVSYDPDNDIDLFFDSSVSLDDIELINILRTQISKFFAIKDQHVSRAEENNVKQMLDLEEKLSQKQKKCRNLLFRLLFKTRMKRSWFSTQYAPVTPSYRWGAFEDPQNYRDFTYKDIRNDILIHLDSKATVFFPHTIPILYQSESWEKRVYENVINLEKENFDDCVDLEKKLYICKLCMFCTFSKVELQAHISGTINTEHKESVFIFHKIYSLLVKSAHDINELLHNSLNENTCEEFGSQGDGSTFHFNSLTYQEELVNEMKWGEVNRYGTTAVALESKPQSSRGKGGKANNKNAIYSLESLKSTVNHVINSESNNSQSQKGVNLSALSDYLEDTEILATIKLNLLPKSDNFSKLTR